MSNIVTFELNKTLQSDNRLTKENCLKFYSTIFNSFVEVFKKTNIQITNESMNWIAQSFYDSITINGSIDQGLDPNIFDKRASLDNIETKELILLAMLLKGSDLIRPLVWTIKRRS